MSKAFIQRRCNKLTYLRGRSLLLSFQSSIFEMCASFLTSTRVRNIENILLWVKKKKFFFGKSPFKISLAPYFGHVLLF